MQDDTWTVAGKTFRSRLIVGTGKYKDYAENAAALEASGAEIVTVALRRVNVADPGSPKLVDFIDPKKYTYLPNTAGCYTAEDAMRTLRLAREAGGWSLVKLEVLGDRKTLYPDMIETLRAAEILVKDGFNVMVYCTDDPLMCKRLEDAGGNLERACLQRAIETRGGGGPRCHHGRNVAAGLARRFAFSLQSPP